MAIIVLLYYCYTHIPDISLETQWQSELCSELALLGRIRLSHEGINGTVSGTPNKIQQYIDKMTERGGELANIHWKKSNASSNPFPNLRIVTRKTLVNLGAHTELEWAKNSHLEPREWHNELQTNQNKIILDVRNEYESAIGYFKDAELAPIRQFSNLPKYLDSLVERIDEMKDKPKVFMYCTGGIRCETAAAYLQHKLGDSSNVYQLKGGIHSYLDEFDGKESLWKGKNFVFDGRLVQPDTHTDVVGHCVLCGVESDDYTENRRCKNCRLLIVVCKPCSLANSTLDDKKRLPLLDCGCK